MKINQISCVRRPRVTTNITRRSTSVLLERSAESDNSAAITKEHSTDNSSASTISSFDRSSSQPLHERRKVLYYFSVFSDLVHGGIEQKIKAGACLAASYTFAAVIFPPIAGKLGATAVFYLPVWMLPYPQLMQLSYLRWLAQEHMRNVAFTTASSNTPVTTAMLGQFLHFTSNEGPQMAADFWSTVSSLPGKFRDFGSNCLSILGSYIPFISGSTQESRVFPNEDFFIIDQSQFHTPLPANMINQNLDPKTVILELYSKSKSLKVDDPNLQKVFDQNFGLVPYTKSSGPKI